MMRFTAIFLAGALLLPAQQERAGRADAREWLERSAVAGGLELSAADFDGVFLAKEFRSAHNGVTHLRYRQSFEGLEVWNADWVVNLDRDGQILNSGGTLYPRPAVGLAPPQFDTMYGAVRAAAIAVNPRAGEAFLPVPKGLGTEKTQVFERGAFGAEIAARPVWYGWRGALRPAWLVEVMDTNAVDNFLVFIDPFTNATIEKQAMTFYQRPQGLVFTGSSPQPNPQPGVRLDGPPAFVERTLVPFTGDLVASPEGWVSDGRTAGNNTITGLNPLGITLLANPATVAAENSDFQFPLEVGPGAPLPTRFAEAAAVNLFYWTNRSHDLFYAAGFDEGAGNYQQRNFGRGGVEGDPMMAYAHFGSAATGLASLNNAFYTTTRTEDGSRAGIHMYLSRPSVSPVVFYSDGSLDAEVIVHEYAHGVTTRLIRQMNSTFQGAAMNEALSDFFSLEFTLPEGAPPDGVYLEGEYFAQVFGTGIRAFPYTTDMAVNPLTYARLGSVNEILGIHDNGGIWMMALWEMRANLIRQFGETEGRRRARLLVIDGMKLSPPAPSMVDLRDAILLADRVTFRGQSQSQLWAAFAKRGLGVMALSGSGNSVHVHPSFETPSNEGRIAFFEERLVIGELARVILYDGNLTAPSAGVRVTSTSGDIENVQLVRQGSVYSGSISTTLSANGLFGGAISLSPGDYIEAHYVDYDTGSGAKLIQASIPVDMPFTLEITSPRQPLSFPNEEPMRLRGSGVVRDNYRLPFAFPFFGKRYNHVRVGSSGLLSFEFEPADGCRDTTWFSSIRGICPLCLEMRTNGVEQKDEDVYVSSTSDSITFRWAGETQQTSAFVPAQPLNFAATLYRDGAIEFHYGSGNTNIPTAFPSSCGAGPVVGLSTGNQTYTVVSTVHTGRVNLENAQGARWVPPLEPGSLPEVRIETEIEGRAFRDTLPVSGIAYDSSAGIAAIQVFLDGQYVTRGSITNRTDVCNREALPGCPSIGLQAVVPLGTLDLAPGPHTLQLRVISRRGAVTDYPRQPYNFTVEKGGSETPVARIEAPVDGAEVSGTVNISGYAYVAGATIVSVDVLVDGITIGRAVGNQPSEAACAGVTNAPNCPRAGFRLTWDSQFSNIPIPNGEHKISLRLNESTGRVWLTAPLAAIHLANAAEQFPIGVLETVKNGDTLRGVVKVAGYVYDPDGRVAALQVYLNGRSAGTPRTGVPRPDACAALQGVTQCPNIGFEFDLDTTLYADGPYTLGLRAVDNRGNLTMFPRVVENGVNVVIANR